MCDFHRSMVDGGYTLDELRAERDAEDDDTQKLPDISHLVNALTEGDWHEPKVDQRYETPKADDSGCNMHRMAAGQASVEMPVEQLEAEYVQMAIRLCELEAERDALAAQLRKQGRVIDTLKRARDRYLQRLTDVRAERDALKAAARTWKRAAKRWRSDYHDLMADFTELTEAFEEADNGA